MPGKLQYGDGIKAFAIHLIISQMVALNRVQKQIAAMIDTIISEASLLKYVLRLYQALEDWEATAIKKLLQAPSIHVDETSFKVERKNHWIHVCYLRLKMDPPKRFSGPIPKLPVFGDQLKMVPVYRSPPVSPDPAPPE